jgi:purine-binding chemotaxis protein CheW
MPAADSWVLTFRIGATEHALPVGDVLEVVRMVALTPLPDGPPWLRGAVNYRGRLLPVLDARTRLGLPARAPDLSMPIVMVRAGDAAAGLIVDEALDVLRLVEAPVEPPARSAAERGVVSGLVRTGDRVVVLLDAAGICADPTAVPVASAL